jgi:hypothetical protein
LILVELSATEIPIEAGGTAQLTVSITNKQDHDDHVFIEIEGIDVEWYALPVPAVNVAAGESQSARVLFKIARAAQSLAGTYPFIVRARGMESGESGIQQASLIVKPFSSLQVELSPRRAASTAMHHASVVEVRVSNQGNKDETLDLYASDPEDGCAYEFEKDRVTIKPGRSETVPLVIEPVTRPVLGASRLFGYVVTARSVDDSYVSCNANGQLERRALLSPFVFLGAVLLLVLGMTWSIFRPREALVTSFTANPIQVMAGDDVELEWKAPYFTEAYIQPDNIPVRIAEGSATVKPTKTTEYKLVAKGRGGVKDTVLKVLVEVTQKPASPKPRIREFTADKMLVHQGDNVTLSWKVEWTDTIHLNPVNSEHEAQLYKSQVVTPTAPATKYILTAKGKSGFAEKELTIKVVDPKTSIAEIKSFKAKPASIFVGEKSTLSWTTANANSVEIDNGIGGGKDKSGKFEVSPDQTTTYTLRALDDKGNVRTAQVTLTVKPKPEQPPATNPPGTEPP